MVKTSPLPGTDRRFDCTASVTRAIIKPDGTRTATAFNSTHIPPNLYPKVCEYPNGASSTPTINTN